MGTTCDFTRFNNLDINASSILEDSSDRQTRSSEIKTCGWGRDRTVDLTIFSRTLVPTELPSRKTIATQTGLEPATSAVTVRRANQLRYWANRSTHLKHYLICELASPTGFEPVLPP